MPQRDERRWEDRINQIVEDAVESMDFAQLERNIRNTIDSVFEEWKIGPGTAPRRPGGPQSGRRPYTAARGPQAGQVRADRVRTHYTSRRYTYDGEAVRSEDSGAEGSAGQGAQTTPPQPRRFPRTLPGSVSSVIHMAMGGFFTFAFGLGLIGVIGEGLAATLAVLAFLAGSVAWLGTGIEQKRRISRFHTYISVLAGRTYCSVQELAAAVNKKPAFVVRDLQTMFRKRFFLQGHMDMQKTTLMTDDETYRQYLQSQESYLKRLEEEKAARPATDSQDPELLQALEEGRSYIAEIRAANDDIPGEEISRKLYQLEDVLKKIFLVLEQDPAQLPKLRKFMTYYMPTTRKLVQTYRDLDRNSADGDNVRKAKSEIEQTLDTINEAYAKLLDSFYEDAVMDIRSDRSVLETMLTQDGLTESPFGDLQARRGQQ